MAPGVSARDIVIDIPSLTGVGSMGEGNKTLELMPRSERNESMAPMLLALPRTSDSGVKDVISTRQHTT